MDTGPLLMKIARGSFLGIIWFITMPTDPEQ